MDFKKHQGYDNGFNGYNTDYTHYMSQLTLVGSKTVTNLVTSLSSEGHPVTCIIYTIMLPWAADVARHLGIPSVLYWIQPATVFSIYYRYFHGHDGLIDSHKDDPSFQVKLPNLPPLEIQDLPSFLLSPNDVIYSFVFKTIEQLFGVFDREEAKPTVLVNTFDALEVDALTSVEEVEMIGIGPDLFEHGTEGYMEWLDSKPPSSVVYVSFGTLAVLQEKQMEEISKGLELSGRDFLWVVNKMQRREVLLNERGMFVNWCNQMEVLSHPSIGCFVTHCGWNSTVESLVSGVPTVRSGRRKHWRRWAKEGHLIGT
ncbi:UDP-glycosyltransferase 75D1 [Acorus gramineus]|uniref:UDP-glycosyltransferase 75D1 n=1 Tax=Acorus gramineus TaxID=55184 RepID=A0AAV9B6H5_ACOGR|nr:UDP-glycosyltransferase 75D1 [Acorus gramineus]